MTDGFAYPTPDYRPQPVPMCGVTDRAPRAACCARRRWHLRRLPQAGELPAARRVVRPAAALAPRRVALELAVRTFLKTSADLILVSLPTPRFIVLVFERKAIDAQAVNLALDPYPAADGCAQLRRIVDAATLPHLRVRFAPAPTPSGRDSLLASPLDRA
jgi:hypothetical protein